MSAQLPSFSFPEPGPVLPPLPESTIEPLPSQDDPRLEHVGLGMDPLQWYIYSALGNKSNYPTDYYTYGESKIHVGDIIEPKFVAPESNPSGAESNAWFLRWEMMCLLCPSTTDGKKRDRDSGTGYPFCDQATLTVAPARSYSESTVDSNGNEKLTLKIPESNVSDVDSLTACAVEQVLQPSWISKLDAEYPRVISQIFIVSRKPRERAPWIYNEFNIWGYEEDPIEDASSSISSRASTPTSTGYSTPSSWVSSSSGSTENHKDDSLKAAARIGMITGIIVGIICFVTFLGCCMHQRKRMEKEAGQLPTVAPSRRVVSCRRDARYELAEVDRSRNEALAPRPPAEQDDPELPPAYYKVVTNVERMEIEQNMYRQARASTGWPPSYRDAQNASTTSAPNSPSVSPVSARGPAPYPALPPSPRR